jgi:hypothetical protein
MEVIEKWLVSHGHGADAEAVLRRGTGAGGKPGKKVSSGDSQRKQRKS